jgi:hypothetical protein
MSEDKTATQTEVAAPSEVVAAAKTESKPAKKTPATRVYPVTDFEGKERFVEAVDEARAIRHVYKPKTRDPLNAPQTLALIRERGADIIEKAA